MQIWKMLPTNRYTRVSVVELKNPTARMGFCWKQTADQGNEVILGTPSGRVLSIRSDRVDHSILSSLPLLVGPEFSGSSKQV